MLIDIVAPTRNRNFWRRSKFPHTHQINITHFNLNDVSINKNKNIHKGDK